MTGIDEQKRALRKELRQIRCSVTKERKELLDSALVKNIIALDEFKNSDIILCYFPVKGEPDLLAIFDIAKELGKTVAFPISHKEDHRLSFHSVEKLDELSTGEYGIAEPDSDSAQIMNFENALCIVPALAYDKKGYRMGYGGGYYDRFLANFCGASVGAVYGELFVDSLPRDGFDRRIDIIITEKGVEVTNEKIR